MQIEMTVPSYLHLGYVHANSPDNAMCELGITLQHPQIQLVARPAPTLSVSGARAELAYQQAQAVGLTGEIEIETAIPAHMGLGSDDMLGASMKRVHTAWHVGHPSFRMTLPQRAFAQGGLLLNDDDGLLQSRAAIAHQREDESWVFVLVLPKEPDDIADNFEAQQQRLLRKSTQHLTRSLNAQTVFDAVQRDDFGGFATALADIHAANEAALAASGNSITLTHEASDILTFMRANGAALAHQTLTGLGLYGLVKGGPASRNLRAALTQRLSYFGPLVMATICDNEGARIKR